VIALEPPFLVIPPINSSGASWRQPPANVAGLALVFAWSARSDPCGVSVAGGNRRNPFSPCLWPPLTTPTPHPWLSH